MKMKRIAICLGVLFWTLASMTAQAQDYPRGDVDQDGAVSIFDVTSLIDYLLNGSWPDTPSENHEWVDLGLPSGTLWATCNVGASAPEEYGYYFAWGETETRPKYIYSMSSYKWSYDDYDLIKYCTISSPGYNGFIDGKTELDPEDDAAYVNWGSSWRMPTYEQLQELIDNCISEWTTLNGVNGRLFTGPNGNSLFLPASGYRWEESLIYPGSEGYIWSRTLDSSISSRACGLIFNSIRVYLYEDYRFTGHVVRAVRVS